MEVKLPFKESDEICLTFVSYGRGSRGGSPQTLFSSSGAFFLVRAITTFDHFCGISVPWSSFNCFVVGSVTSTEIFTVRIADTCMFMYRYM